MPSPLRREAVVGKQVLSWRETGDGPPVVLIHGIGGSSESWGFLIEDLARRYRVLAWDAPGYGASELLDGTATADAYAGRLAALLRQEGIAAAHLMAHSIGAPIATALCRAGGVTVTTLTLIHPVAGFGGMAPEQRDALRAARLADIEGITMEAFGKVRAPQIMGRAARPPIIDEAARIIATIPEAGYRAMVEVMASSDLFAALPDLQMPALVIAGEDDAVAPPDACRKVADALADAACETRPGIGHYLPLEDPASLLASLDRFLDGHGRAG